MTRVKICGITSVKDAKMAVQAGADAIGLVFAPSPRRVTPALAKKIVQAVGPWTTTIGVFVNQSPRTIQKVVRDCGLSGIQLHGDEPPSSLDKMKVGVIIKAFRVGNDFKQKKIRHAKATAFLFDTKVSGKYGGTGKTFNWKVLEKKKFTRPFILSGGLHPKNVEAAIKTLRPYGVDTSGGVEKAPGKKDPKLVKEFIRNAKKT